MDTKLSKIYYSPQGYWKGIASIKKLATAANVSESDSKNGWCAEPFGKSIFLRQNTFLAPKIPRPPQKPFTRQTFFSFDRILLGVATYKYALTVVDVASRFKEAEPLTSKESAEVARCFQKIYKRGPLRWPQFCKWTQGASSWELSPKRWKNKWNDLAKEIWLWCAEQNIWLTAVHVPGVKNVEADRQSRLPHSSLEWTLDNTVFKDCISERNVLPTIDLLASRISHQLPNYVSWHPNPGAVAIDALYLSWKECVP